MRKLAISLTILTTLALIVAGCGGGGGGGGVEPPPPPPPTQIGPGPGAAADVVPAEPGVDTTAARNAPKATNPSADNVRQVVTNEFDAIFNAPPDTGAELQTLLTKFAAWMNQDPDDPAAQTGLALLTAFAAIYNTGVDAGFAEGDILPTSLVKGDTLDLDLADLFMRPMRFAAALQFFGPQALQNGTKGPKAVIPGLEGEGITTQDLQLAVRNYFLPLLDDAIARLSAVANNANAWEPIIVIGSGEDEIAIYAADFKIMTSILRLFKAMGYEFVAYQLNAGDYDWGVDLVDRDANGNGILGVGEYAPADPFLWRHSAPNMQIAGATYRTAINNMIWALDNGANSALLNMLDAQTANDMATMLADLRTLISQRVNVQVTYENVAPAQMMPAATATIPVNFGAIFDNPVNDVKDLLPRLHVVCDGPSDCWAEVQSSDDFPDLTFNGVFPQPQQIVNIMDGDYNHVTISYGSLEDFELVTP